MRLNRLKKEKAPEQVSSEESRENSGWRNLVLMAFLAALISVGLTVISVAIYHYSGDIYLDRSRPGYLPDTEEVETEEEVEEGVYSFEKTGAVTKEVLNEYLEKMQIELEALDEYQNPFGEETLSNEHFGL